MRKNITTRSVATVITSFVLTIILCMAYMGCSGIQTKESPSKHIIYPHMSGTIYLVNGDSVEVVNSVVSITPEVVRIESTMVRMTILVQNVKTIALYNVDHHQIKKE